MLISQIVQRLLRRVVAHHANRSAPSAPRAFPISKPAGCEVWYGVGCQIHRQAGHGAAHRLATYLEAAELIPRLARRGSCCACVCAVPQSQRIYALRDLRQVRRPVREELPHTARQGHDGAEDTGHS